jgi:ATP-binding cassette subfamily C protein CydC
MPYRKWILLGIFLALATVLANVGLLALSSWFIASMAVAGATGSVMNWTLPAAGVRALALARTGGRYLERLVNHNVTFHVLANLRLWFYERIEPLAPARLAAFRSGDLLSRIRADVDTLDDFYVRGVVPLVVALLSVATIVSYLLHYSAIVALIDLAFLLAAGLGLPTLLSRLGARPGQELIETASELRTGVVNHADGMAELVAFGAIDEHEEQILSLSKRYDSRHVTMSRLSGITDSAMVLCMNLAMWGTLLAAIPLVNAGRADGPTLAMLLVFALGSFESVMPLPEVARRLGEMRTAAGRLFELIDARPEVSDPTTPAGKPDSTAIEIRGLTLRYEREGKNALDGVDIDVREGGRIAIVGPTGSGKTSLTNVLLRFWEYEKGSVRIGGAELREMRQEEARSLISVAPQRPYLFHSTIRENLTLGRPDADETEIMAAVRAAQIETLIRELPDGLDTTVGEAGRAFSSGQGRRIAIARALIKSAPVLILDEPTEGLDGPTAERLITSVFEYACNSSIILITHLLFGLGQTEEIFVFRGGKVEARGPLDNPEISRLLSRQTGRIPDR